MTQAAISERLAAAGAATVAVRPPSNADDSAERFEAIYNAYRPLLRRIAMRKFDVSREDAESLVHDVFVTYLANPSNVRDLHAYLIGAICNASRQHLRRNTKERALFCDLPVCAATPSEELVDGVVRNLVIRATMKRLGPSCRDALERFCLDGETAPAIARSRNTTANYIWRLLSLCRSRARAIYATMRRTN